MESTTKLAPRPMRSIMLCLVALVALTALDLWTKSWAQDRLSSARPTDVGPACTPDPHGRYRMQRQRTDEIVLVPDYLELRYAENCGGAFSMLGEAPRWLRVTVFMGAGLVFIAAMSWMLVRGHGGALFAAAVPLVLSGAIGNMVDRGRLGYVIDFIRFHVYDKFDWPIFNVADVSITVGFALLVLDGVRRPARAGGADAAGSAGEAAA
jgi:signal peptidase II